MATGATPVSNPVATGNPQDDVIKTLQDRISHLEDNNTKTEQELESLKKDQVDLLMLLEDQDTKLMAFKNRLRELGETIEDSDDNNSGVSENENENEA